MPPDSEPNERATQGRRPEARHDLFSALREYDSTWLRLRPGTGAVAAAEAHPAREQDASIPGAPQDAAVEQPGVAEAPDVPAQLQAIVDQLTTEVATAVARFQERASAGGAAPGSGSSTVTDGAMPVRTGRPEARLAPAHGPAATGTRPARVGVASPHTPISVAIAPTGLDTTVTTLRVQPLRDFSALAAVELRLARLPRVRDVYVEQFEDQVATVHVTTAPADAEELRARLRSGLVPALRADDATFADEAGMQVLVVEEP